jgi:hypothetical protein
VTQFDPVALNVMKHLPVPTGPCGQVTYGIPSTGDEDQFIGRGDYSRSMKHFLFVRYFLADYRNPAVYDPADALVTQRAGNLERSQSFTFGDSYSFTPRIVNSLHVTAARLRNNRGPAPDAYNAVSLGAKMYNYDSAGMQLSVSNAFTTNCGTCAPAVFNRNTFQEADDVDMLLGKHQLAFGVNIIRAQQNLNGHYNSNGLFQFNGTYSKDPMLDFLLGKMSTFGQSRSQVNVYRQTVPGLYIQDTYKVTTRFLINAGLRWEPQLFPQDLFGRGNTFIRSAFNASQHSIVYPNAPAGMLFYGDAGVPKAFTTDKLANLSPRLGIVINPHGDGRETFRAGVGLLYDTPEEYYAERLTTNAPYGGEIDQTNPGPLSDPWRNYPGGNPFPGTYPPTSSTTFPIGGTYAFLPQSLRPTYTTQWNASYERQITNDWLFTLTYLGNKTSHLWLNLDINPAVYLPGQCGSAACSTTANTSQRRVLYLANPSQGQYYGQIVTTDDGANAFYNGLLVSIQHRFRHGFTFLANHTWSHCISDGDFTGNLGNPQYQNQASRLADRGDCNFDIRHIFNATFVGTSPGAGNTWMRRLDKDWQIAPLVRLASGLPVNVLTGKDNSLTADGMDRPNVVPGARLYAATRGPNLQWLNAAAFTANPLGTFGNLRRDALRAPGQVNFDISVSRIFPIRERFRLEARAEAFNVINHPNFGSPVASISSSSFGRLTSANDPRILQFSGKLHF